MSKIRNTINQERFYFNKKNNKTGKSLVEVYEGNRISETGLKWYLELGYIPGKETLFDGIEVLWDNTAIEMSKTAFSLGHSLNKEYSGDSSISAVTKKGGQLFNSVVDSLYKQSDKNVVLPLTSGLDSRMLLGGLLECTEAHNIQSFTWGEPGSLDYEVGKKISKKLGIKHSALDISKYKLTEERLFAFAKASDCSVALFDHWPVDSVKEIVNSSSDSIWMGLLGGSLSGANLPKTFVENPYASFLKSNNRIQSVTSLSAALLGSRPTIEDLQEICSGLDVNNHDVLDILLHHNDLIVPTKIHKDFNYVLPFADTELIEFFTSVPLKHRRYRRIFKEIILKHYPDIARFPCNRTEGLGLHIKPKTRKRIKKYRKYVMPWNERKKQSKYVSLKAGIQSGLIDKKFVEEKLRKLEDRSLLKTNVLRQLKSEFYGNDIITVDHSRALDVLISLEVILELVDYK